MRKSRENTTHHVEPVDASGESAIADGQKPAIPLLWQEKSEPICTVPDGLDRNRDGTQGRQIDWTLGITSVAFGNLEGRVGLDGACEVDTSADRQCSLN